MRCNRRWICFGLLLFILPDVYAQPKEITDTKPDILALKSYYGFIIPHRKNLKNISQSRPWGIQLEWARHHITQKAWDYCGCYPRVGLTFNYTNFGDPNTLGNSYASTAFIEPFISYKGRWHPSFRIGFGVTYLDNIYDATSNPENLFFSYPISFFVHADLNLHYELNEKWNLTMGASYPHISNGGINQPNKGINFPVASLGVEYKPQPVNFIDRNRQKTIEDIHGKRWYFMLQPFVSRKDVVEHEEKYTVLGMTATANRIVSRLSAVSLGVEVIHDGSVKEQYRRTNNDDLKPSIVSVLAGHDLLMGKFTLSTQLGYYFQKPSPDKHDVYQRIGLQYQLVNNLSVGLSMKTHTSVADFVDFRLGFKL